MDKKILKTILNMDSSQFEAEAKKVTAKVGTFFTEKKDSAKAKFEALDGANEFISGCEKFLGRLRQEFGKSYDSEKSKSEEDGFDPVGDKKEPEGDPFSDMGEMTNGLFSLIVGLTGRAAKVVKDTVNEVSGEVKEFFEEISEDAKEFMGGSNVDIEDLKTQIAKLRLMKRMYAAAKIAGFSEEEATELCLQYLKGNSILDTLKEMFPNEHSPKLQEFIIEFSRKNRKFSKEEFLQAFKQALKENDDPELWEGVIKEMSISRSLWYKSITDEQLTDFFGKLYKAYVASKESNRTPKEALDQQVKTLLRSI